MPTVEEYGNTRIRQIQVLMEELRVERSFWERAVEKHGHRDAACFIAEKAERFQPEQMPEWTGSPDAILPSDRSQP